MSDESNHLAPSDSAPSLIDPATAEPTAAPPANRRRMRLGVQTLAFILGLLLLWWCAAQALSEENQAQIRRLGEASVLDIGLLAGLSLVSVILNGLVFWVVLLPVQRIGVLGVVATNALASFLNYLPFKLSVLARVIIHGRRDRVPFFTIGAWFAAVGCVLVGVYAPLVSVSLWRHRIDWVWLAAGGGGVLGVLGVAVLVARLLAGERGSLRLETLATRLLDRFDARIARWLLRTRIVARLMSGFDMLGSPAAVGAGAACYLADLGVQTSRFVIAATVLGVTISWQDATLVASCYFIIGVASPAGQLGTREAGTAWLAGVLHMAGGESLAVVMLLASAVESLVALGSAGAAIFILRPARILWGGTGATTPGGPNPPGESNPLPAQRQHTPG